MSSICTRYSRLALGRKSGGGQAMLIRLRCKQWACEHCAKINKKQWQKRLIEGIKSIGGMWSFWTLTHDLDAVETPLIDQREHLSKCFNRLMTKLRRHHDGGLKYVRVIEIGKQNTQRMHMHMLVNIHVDDAHLVVRRDKSEYWHSATYAPMITSSGFGVVSDVRNVTSLVSDRPVLEQAVYTASYVSKYMAKQDSDTVYPKHTRRFSVSRGWPAMDHEEGYGDDDMLWVTADVLTETMAQSVWIDKQHIVDIQRDERVTLDDFVDAGGVYTWLDPALSEHPLDN